MSNGNGHHWSKFIWRDHIIDPALRDCSLAAKGFWVGILALMHEGTPVGHLTVAGVPATIRQMASFVNCPVKQAEKALAELEAARVFSRTEDGTIYSRRMVKDAEVAEAAKAWGKTGGNPSLKAKANGAATDHKLPRGVNPPVNDPPNPPPLTPTLTGRVNGGVFPEVQVQSEVEEKKVSKFKDLLSSTSPASARVVEACEAPPAGTYGDPALALAAQTIVEKLGRKFESSGKNPQGKPPKLTIIEQINWVRRGPVLDSDPVLLEGEILEAPIRRGPQPPQRTVAEQLAALGFPQRTLEAAE